MSEGVASSPDRAFGAVLARLRWLGPVVAGLATAAIAEVSLGEGSIQASEAERLTAARSSIGAIWDTARAEDMTHLTTHLVWKPWLALAGSSETAARLPALVFAALAAAAVVLLARELAGWTAGAVAGAVVATNGFVLESAVTADGTSLALLLAVVATLALVKAARGDHPAWWAAYALAALATVSVDLASGAIVVAHIAYVALLRPAAWMRAAAAFGVVLVGSAAYLALVSRSAAWRLDWLDDPTGRTLGEALWEVSGRNPVAVVGAVAGLVVVGAGWTRARAIPTWGLLGLWLVGPLVATLAVSLWRPAFTADALVTTTGAIAVLCGAAVAAAGRLRVGAAVVASACFALAVGSVASVAQHLAEDERPDWRQATAYVVEERAPADDVVVVPRDERAAFSYYAGSVPVTGAPGSDAVWVVASAGSPRSALDEGRAAVGAPAYALLEERRFDTLMVQRWVRP